MDSTNIICTTSVVNDSSIANIIGEVLAYDIANAAVNVTEPVIASSNVIDLTAIVAIVAALITACTAILSTYLTNRDNIKLADNARLEGELRDFAESCGKYIGISSILSLAFTNTYGTNLEDHYTDDHMKELRRNEFIIFSHIDRPDMTKIGDLMCKLMTYAIEMADQMNEHSVEENNVQKHSDELIKIRNEMSDIQDKLLFEFRNHVQKKRDALARKYGTKKT